MGSWLLIPRALWNMRTKGDFCLRIFELFPGFSGFRTFHRTNKIDHPNFEGGLSFNRSSVSQEKDINMKTNSTWRQKSMFHVLYGIFSVDKALLVDTWHRRHPVDNSVGFPDTYPLDSDLSDGKRYPTRVWTTRAWIQSHLLTTTYYSTFIRVPTFWLSDL